MSTASRPPDSPDPSGAPIEPGIRGGPIGVALPARIVLPTVAVLMPLTGDYASFGESCLRGIKLALGTEAGASPSLRMVVVDTRGSAAEAVVAFQQAVANPSVIAVLGPVLAWELGAIERNATQDLPVVTFSQRRVPPGGPILRFSMTREDQAAVLADYVVSELELDVWAVVHPKDSYGDDLAASFRGEVRRRGGSVSAIIGYDTKAVDFQPALNQLRAALGMKEGDAPPIDGIFLPDSAERAATLVPFLAFNGLGGLQLLGASSWNRLETLERSEQDLSGAIFVDGFFLHSFQPEVRRFVDAYRDAHASDPGILEAYGYDAARLLADAHAGRGVDRPSMLAALRSPRSLRGATGLSVVRPGGTVDRSLFLLRWQDGVLAEVDRRRPLAGKAASEAPISKGVPSGVAPSWPRPSFDSRTQVPDSHDGRVGR